MKFNLHKKHKQCKLRQVCPQSVNQVLSDPGGSGQPMTVWEAAGLTHLFCVAC